VKFIQKHSVDDPWEMSSGRPGFERETYEGSSQLLPELAIFGWLRFHSTLSGALQPDQHEGTYEIHYLRRGHLRWWVDKEQCEFSAGQLLIIRPGELHGGEEGALQPCEHYWLRIGFPDRGALPSRTEKETADLKGDFERLRFRNYAASSRVQEYFELLLEEHRNASQPHAQTMARSALHALLITILRDHERQACAARKSPITTWRVRRAISLLDERLRVEDPVLRDIAAEVGLSPSGLRARFKTETGFTPHEYLLHRRIQEARRQLAETDEEITAIAHALCFSSSQYFATVFRQQTGLTPGLYRKKHSNPDRS
jgi:AraC-like DNA-binding protein